MKNQVAVLLNSCDKYSDIWEYFFHFFNLYWSDCPYQVYVNTETKTCNYETNVGSIKTCNTKVGMQWSERILKALNCIEEEYVIWFIDDFFLLSKINQKAIDEVVEFAKNYKNFGSCLFEKDIPNTYNTKKVFGDFRIRDKREPYYVSAQITLWKKSYLKKVLRKNESPWDFEWYASYRCAHYKENSFVWDNKDYNLFPIYMKGEWSYGLMGGKWAKGTPYFFEKHGVECDFSKRGFFDFEKQEKAWNKKEKKLSFFDKIKMLFTDFQGFKNKLRPKIKVLSSKIDIKGRVMNFFGR